MSYLDFDKSDKRKRNQQIMIKCILWIVVIFIIILIGYLTVRLTIEKTAMLGNSMGETLYDGDKIIINKLSYIFKKPARFDVIVFKQGGTEHGYYNIKRIIGLPGETVQIVNGCVYINGELLEETINVDPINISGLAEEAIQLEDDEYFVLGDARNNSEDSRFANIGNVVGSDIIGKAWIRTKPSLSIISKINLKNDNESTENKKDPEDMESNNNT